MVGTSHNGCTSHTHIGCTRERDALQLLCSLVQEQPGQLRAPYLPEVHQTQYLQALAVVSYGGAGQVRQLEAVGHIQFN